MVNQASDSVVERRLRRIGRTIPYLLQPVLYIGCPFQVVVFLIAVGVI